MTDAAARRASATPGTCTATLDAPAKDAAPAFEKACQAIAIEGDD